MDTKVNQDYGTAKIVVDTYHPQTDGRLICSCYTPGATSEIEPEYLVKTVTQTELNDHLTDGFGIVFIAISDKEANIITLDEYLEQVSTAEMAKYCEAIINKRENRNHYFTCKAAA